MKERGCFSVICIEYSIKLKCSGGAGERNSFVHSSFMIYIRHSTPIHLVALIIYHHSATLFCEYTLHYVTKV